MFISIGSMQLALALESKTRVRFEEATAGTYCTDAAGHTVYSLTFSGGGGPHGLHCVVAGSTRIDC